MTEVLVALFVMALGTIAILVAGLIVFPAVVAGQSSNIQITVEAPNYRVRTS